ncbi:hypothetical protein PR048_018274 [Dryococelus australis]|uniref:Uncharacterized protein n=1 Tax=Dryococelus australis TaxID=614101 RepID=A0ABQ9HBU9_9NEOP|nr:hypothetical protein PR048_018274 [Dryococelus australis]
MYAHAGIAWVIIPQTWSVDLPWCTYNSWRIFVAICSLPSVLGCLLTACVLPESPKYLMAHGETEKTLKVLRHMYALNTGSNEDNYKVNQHAFYPATKKFYQHFAYYSHFLLVS